MTFQAPPPDIPRYTTDNRTIDDLTTELEAFGLKIPGAPITDGEIHRVPVPSSKTNGDKAGWYAIATYENGLIYADYGDWRENKQHKWRSRDEKTFTAIELAAIKQQQDKVRAEREKLHADAAEDAKKIWEAAIPATDHPYLTTKGIQAHGTRIAKDGRLIVPVFIGDKGCSLQHIDNAGNKIFHKGGKTSGGSYQIPGNLQTAVIVEGFSTAASIAEATGFTVYCAFTAGNLEKVVAAAKPRHTHIIIAGDDDKGKEINTGRRAAEMAAAIHRCVVVFPTFSDESTNPTDFNDMARIDGPDAVKAVIAGPQPASTYTILSSAEFVAGFTAPDYLVEGIIQRRYLYSMTARTGHGKTAVLLTLAAMVAEGRCFNTAETCTGRVCYLAGENPDDIRARWLLMSEVFSFDAGSIDVHFIPSTFSIPEMSARIAEEAEEVGGFDLVIIDTSAAYFQEDEENNNVQLGHHARDMRELTKLPGGPGIVVACHPTKNAGRENLLPRGGGAFIAEVDGNLTLWSEDKTTTEMHWCGKFRGPEFEPMSFKMEPRTCDSVKDSKGRLMPSVVALPVTDADAQAQLAATLRDEDTVLLAMLEDPSSSMAQIALDVGWLTAETNEPRKSKVERAIHSLKSEGFVKKHRKKWVLTLTGKGEAGKIAATDKQGLLP